MRGLVRTLTQLSSINAIASTKSGQFLFHNPLPLLFFQKPYSTQDGGGADWEEKKHVPLDDSSCPDFFVSHDREFHVASLPFKPEFKVMPEDWHGTTRDPDGVLYEASVTEDELLYQEFFQEINFNKMKVKCHKYSSRYPSQGSNFMAEKLGPQGKRGNGGDQSKHAAQAVRALPIRILTVGKKMSAGVQLIVDDYIQKLKHYCPIEDVRIKSNPKNARDAAVQIEHEDMAVMGLIKSNEWVVMLDEHGLNLDSHQMASLIADAGNTGASSILFCIGGPYGHGRQLRERADVSIRLSSLVLNHEIALVVLAEQLYRSWTILKGQKYHH